MLLWIEKLLWNGVHMLHRIGTRVKREHLLSRFKETGRNFSFDPRSAFITPETIRVGHDVFIGMNAHLSGEISIGDGCMFGPSLILVAGNHYFGVKGRPVSGLKPRAGEKDAPITIEREVWGGAGVIILGGVTIGMGAVIGAGSLVSRDIPPYVVAAGNPCRPLKRIFQDDALLEHLEALGLCRDDARRVLDRRSEALSNASATARWVDQTDSYLAAWGSKEGNP